jgi:hypothetical protein
MRSILFQSESHRPGGFDGTAVAERQCVRVLEARFHPRRRDGPESVMVGLVVWERDEAERPTVRAAPSPIPMQPDVPQVALVKLQYLVDGAAPNVFEQLLGLRSRYWSFLDVSQRFMEKGDRDDGS